MKIKAIFLALLVSACSQELQLSHSTFYNLDLDKIELESTSFLNRPDTKNYVVIDESWIYPEYITSLQPKRIWTEESGVFIRFQGNEKSESGLFILKDGSRLPENLSYKPDFKLISNRAYSYIIKT